VLICYEFGPLLTGGVRFDKTERRKRGHLSFGDYAPYIGDLRFTDIKTENGVNNV
jgi:hypothetical protein